MINEDDKINENDIRKAALNSENILDPNVRDTFECRRSKKNEGLAYARHGGFCLAFPMTHKSSNERICYRIWYNHNHVTEAVARHVAKKLKRLNLPFFIDYEYLPSAILVNGKSLPGVKMKWIEGAALNDYISNHRHPADLFKLAKSFKDMCKQMCDAGVSHGDLSNSNILVSQEGRLYLIDYDSVYVPSLGGKYHHTTDGQAAFQHPQREEGHIMSSRDDYFSQQVIYLSLLGIANKPSLADKISDDELLFNALDLGSPIKFRKKANELLSGIDDCTIKLCVEELEKAISSPLSEIRSIVDFIQDDITRILLADYCGQCGHYFDNQIDLFCPDCGKQREMLT